MKVRTLQLEDSQMARLRVESQMARLSIDSRLRRIKEINQQPAQMMVTRQNPSIEVETANPRNSAVLRSEAVPTFDYVAETAGIVEQGNKVARSDGENTVSVPRGQSVIPKITRRKLASAPAVSATRGADMPTTVVRGNPGSISINWSIQDIKIVWDDYQAPVIRLDPKPYVNIELAQDARIEFRVVEQNIPREAGRTIDKEA